MPRRLPIARQRLAAAAVTTLIGLTLVACTPEPAPSPEPSVTASLAPTTSPTPTPEGPTFHPDGTAEDNLPIFTLVTQQVWDSGQTGSGRAYIDALIAAGFNRDDMQVTQDATTVGNPAESIQFSVRWGADSCLVGQFGPSTGGAVTAIMDQLAEGRCLVGNTRPIDW
ncbi:hypothetical protein DC31_13560 [Microbacterium sp. CH12i]|uniref:DUF6993 domain-containing protein n=1 Tax=Microbacterium sp. CH12i TaxID=1479651 RepID=UPI000460F4D1|nr:hypothetical protein [Microbacterium sp. CH12i]KDA05526.1 hypothetical protein DC31_13560 [Microbacterium sp. CH12i]